MRYSIKQSDLVESFGSVCLLLYVWLVTALDLDVMEAHERSRRRADMAETIFDQEEEMPEMKANATREEIHEARIRGAMNRQYKKALELDGEASDMQQIILELEEIRAGVKELKRRILIAYSDGCERGYTDTLNHQNHHLFNADQYKYDRLAIEWYATALTNETFARELETEEPPEEAAGFVVHLGTRHETPEPIPKLKNDATKPEIDGLGLLYTQDTETK
jgi:hypothetical protein